MIPKRSRQRMGRMMANSVIVWPCSSCKWMRRMVIAALSTENGGWAPDGGAQPLSTDLRQVADHVLDRRGDAASQKLEDADRGDRQHGEHDSVLRHRLTLLLAPMRAQKVKPLGKRHLISPPFLALARADRRTTSRLKSAIKACSDLRWSRFVE